jgi:hypothetical protein
MSVIYLLTFHILIFSSETAGPNEPKLSREHLWKVLFKYYSFCPGPFTNMAAIGFSFFTIEHWILGYVGHQVMTKANMAYLAR